MCMKGFITLNKPKGMSSSHAVQKVKKILTAATGEKTKVGHFGTLDPLASGVLPIAVGNATRLFDYAQDKVKVYQATFRFGIQTDTLDSEGSVVASSDKIVNKDEIAYALKSFVGRIKQIPPQYSAKSINGKRAYQIAREGKTAELQPKEIEIYDFKLIESTNGIVNFKDGEHRLEENEFAFQIACSSGTYIRALARDLAEAVESVGYMSSLLRIQSGVFLLDDAVSIEEFEENPIKHLKSLEFVLGELEIFDLPDEYADKVLNGVQIYFTNLPNELFAARFDGEIVGLARNIDGRLKFVTRL